jgi:Calcineurin-like phosphoesterase
MPLKACGGAVALLLVLGGCDKLRAFPGLTPARVVPPPAPPPVVLGPWLLQPVPGQVTVAWTTREPSIGRVWYGTMDPDRLATEQGEPVTDHRVVLLSLRPATQYCYRVEGSPETAWFASPPPPGAEGPIKVLIYGNNSTNHGDHALVARAAASEHPHLVLHTGDMVVSAGEEALWKIWFHEEHDLLAHAPILAALGNHEITDTGKAFGRFFQLRGMPAYGSFDYGPVHIVVLNAFEMPAGATPQLVGISETQKAWLDEDLRRVDVERHVWVLVHQSPFAHPAQPRPGRGGSDDVHAAIATAHKIHRIDAVFAGHEPFYERGEIDGIRYFVVGGGGAPLEEPEAGLPGMQAAASALSYASVEVCGCHARGALKNIAGKALDTFTLRECKSPCSVPFNPPVAAASLSPGADGGKEDSRSSRRRSRKRRRGAVDSGASAAENPER